MLAASLGGNEEPPRRQERGEKILYPQAFNSRIFPTNVFVNVLVFPWNTGRKKATAATVKRFPSADDFGR